MRQLILFLLALLALKVSAQDTTANVAAIIRPVAYHAGGGAAYTPAPADTVATASAPSRPPGVLAKLPPTYTATEAEQTVDCQPAGGAVWNDGTGKYPVWRDLRNSSIFYVKKFPEGWKRCKMTRQQTDTAD